MNLCLEKSKSTAYLAVEDPSSISLFGHPLRQSYFGFVNLKQDVGLTAGQSSGDAKPAYIFASLRLYNGIDDISITQAMDCFKTVFTAMCELYGRPTRTSYTDPTDANDGADMYAFPVLNEDGSLNETWLLVSYENAASFIGITNAAVYWSNVKPELSQDSFNYVSIHYPPSEKLW